MSAEDLNLTGVKSLNQALARTRNGTASVELANRLGLWTEPAHQRKQGRPEFPGKLSELTPSQVTDLYAAWTAEYGRILELRGAIVGQDALVRIQLKSAQASARARLRRSLAEGEKSPSSASLNDQVDEDPSVVDLTEQLGVLAVLGAHADAAKEATAQYLATISREISFRDAQMKARIY
jgi:hypothetical protein